MSKDASDESFSNIGEDTTPSPMHSANKDLTFDEMAEFRAPAAQSPGFWGCVSSPVSENVESCAPRTQNRSAGMPMISMQPSVPLFADFQCCHEAPLQSMPLCKPLIPECSPANFIGSCGVDQVQYHGANACSIFCQESQGSKTPNQSVTFSDFMIDASEQQQVLAVTYVPGLGHLHEEQDREHTEVELEATGINYHGQWLGREKHGEGSLSFPDGRTYKGTFSHDLAHGRGTLVMASGAMLEGDWVHGRAEGRGRYSCRGVIYEGEWRNDEKHGRGYETWPDGSSYRGDYLRNLRHGAGTWQTKGGAIYEGQFFEDTMQGEGNYRFADGHTYQGKWINGQQSGYGVIEYPNGFRYEGSFLNNKKDGEGSAQWPDGRAYRGQWKCGLQHGVGLCRDSEGFEEKRQCQNGRIVPGTHGAPNESKGQLALRSP